MRGCVGVCVCVCGVCVWCVSVVTRPKPIRAPHASASAPSVTPPWSLRLFQRLYIDITNPVGTPPRKTGNHGVGTGGQLNNKKKPWNMHGNGGLVMG